MALSAHAQEHGVVANPYVVKDLIVDMKADNAVTAREKAFGEALQQGFARMLEQVMADPIDRAEVRTPSTAELGRMLQDFTTKNEQLSPTRYTATYELRFKPGRVSAYVGGARESVLAKTQNTSNKSVTNSSKAKESHSEMIATAATKNVAPVLVIPFYQDGGRPVLWSAANPLRDALQQQSLGETPIKYTLGDLDDVQVFDETQGLAYAPEQMRALLQKYGVDQALMAIAIPDRGNSHGLTVMMYRAESKSGEPIYIDAVSLSARASEAPVALYARSAAQVRMRAADMAMRAPASIAKTAVAATNPIDMPAAVSEVKAPAAEPKKTALASVTMPVRVRFQSLMEWQQIRSRLDATSVIEKVRVMALKTQEARLELVYTGSEEVMLNEITAQGLNATPAALESNVMAIPANMEPAAGNGVGGKVFYDITLNDQTAAAAPAAPIIPGM